LKVISNTIKVRNNTLHIIISTSLRPKKYLFLQSSLESIRIILLKNIPNFLDGWSMIVETWA